MRRWRCRSTSCWKIPGSPAPIAVRPAQGPHCGVGIAGPRSSKLRVCPRCLHHVEIDCDPVLIGLLVVVVDGVDAPGVVGGAVDSLVLVEVTVDSFAVGGCVVDSLVVVVAIVVGVVVVVSVAVSVVMTVT